MRWRGCRWPSRSRSPDRRVPRSRDRCRCCRRTACDEHLAVGQQRRRVMEACGGEAAGVLKLKGSARARLHEHQPRTEKSSDKLFPRIREVRRLRGARRAVLCYARSMTPAEFKRKWAKYSGKETSAYQEHFNDLCALLGQPSPVGPIPTGSESFCFQKRSGASRRRKTSDESNFQEALIVCPDRRRDDLGQPPEDCVHSVVDPQSRALAAAFSELSVGRWTLGVRL